MEIRKDVWNPMIKLIKKSNNEDVKKEAGMLLEQFNTVTGGRIKKELEIFLRKHYD